MRFPCPLYSGLSPTQTWNPPAAIGSAPLVLLHTCPDLMLRETPKSTRHHGPDSAAVSDNPASDRSDQIPSTAIAAGCPAAVEDCTVAHADRFRGAHDRARFGNAYFPTSHIRQLSSLADPLTREYLPAMQLVHAIEPAADENIPSTQFLH